MMKASEPRPLTSASTRPARGPITLTLDLFSSVKLGITLLTLLFIYCTIGSAGIVLPTRGVPDFSILGIGFQHSMIRQWRPFELTEFAWFHTPIFNALIALICANIIITTIRRIRLSVLNLGVWMIHTGIIILCLGSVIYFSTKVEGDVPVIRRDVVISVPGVTHPVRLAALPGSSTSVMGEDGEYQFRVSQIDPGWRLRSGADEGRVTYGVSVSVTTPTTAFARTLLAGFPEYTEDVIPGRGRVKKLDEFAGRALVDERVKLSLEPRPADAFWLKDSAALYVRPAGAPRWAMRPIRSLPRYNDSVPDVERDIWPVRRIDGGPALENHPLDLTVAPAPPAPDDPAAASDPLAGLRVRVTGFLRYAEMRRGSMDGGETLNPLVDVSIRDDTGETLANATLLALDPVDRSAFNGNLTFDWVNSPADLARYERPIERKLAIRLPATGESLELVIRPEELTERDRPATPIGDSGFTCKVLDIVDRLPLSDNSFVTLVRVEFTTPDSKFVRWVFEDSARTRDNIEAAPEEPHKPQAPDPRIETTYSAGHTVPLTIVAGPAEVGVRVYSRMNSTGAVEMTRAKIGEPITVEEGVRLTINRTLTHARSETRPQIIPWEQRDKDADASQTYAMVRVEISGGGRAEAKWLPFHRYALDSSSDSPPNLTRYEPVEFALAGGRAIEVIVAREKRALPNPVVLDNFILTTNIGGFSGNVSSVRDWTSVLRFQTDKGLSEPQSVSSNDPKEFGGLWFFQAFWDPPNSSQSLGLAFTGLGVGNRNGVYTQLAGCCISVAGMLYAFYVKPIIRRRRKDAALAAHAFPRGAIHEDDSEHLRNGKGAREPAQHRFAATSASSADKDSQP